MAKAKSYRGDAQGDHSRDDWQTPPGLIDGLRWRWDFELDAACSLANAVASMGLTLERSGLTVDWLPEQGLPTEYRATTAYDARLVAALEDLGLPPVPPPPVARRRAVWANPPYGRRGALARTFVERAAQQARDVCNPAGVDVVLLLPATTDVAWFHGCVLGGEYPAHEAFFTCGRVAFIDPRSGEAKAQNVTGSTVVVWDAGATPGGALAVAGMNKHTGLPPGGWQKWRQRRKA